MTRPKLYDCKHHGHVEEVERFVDPRGGPEPIYICKACLCAFLGKTLGIAPEVKDDGTAAD